LDVLSAESTLLNARLTEVSDKYSEIESVILLYHALGGGVE
jgi:multidrug efflux system outer membrane protein